MLTSQPSTKVTNKAKHNAGVLLRAVIIVAVFVAIGYWLWGIWGALGAFLLSILCVMGVDSVRGTRLWNRCEREYRGLLSEGYSAENALLLISESFRPELSKHFHLQVISKFPTVAQVVLFFTIALTSETDEQWASGWLETTAIRRAPNGAYKVKVSKTGT